MNSEQWARVKEVFNAALDQEPGGRRTFVADAGRRESDDAEVNANALLTSAWLSIEQTQYAKALDDVRAARTALIDRPGHFSLVVLADLIGGIAEMPELTEAKKALTGI